MSLRSAYTTAIAGARFTRSLAWLRPQGPRTGGASKPSFIAVLGVVKRIPPNLRPSSTLGWYAVIPRSVAVVDCRLGRFRIGREMTSAFRTLCRGRPPWRSAACGRAVQAPGTPRRAYPTGRSYSWTEPCRGSLTAIGVQANVRGVAYDQGSYQSSHRAI